MRPVTFRAALLSAAFLAAADAPKLSTSAAVVVRAPAGAAGQWSVIGADLGRVSPQTLDDGAAVLLSQPGRYVVVWAGSGVLVTADVTVSGDPVPMPVGPLPIPPGPAPQPPPQPVPPTPIVTPAPIPAAGLYVLIVEETAVRGELPAGQRAIILGTGAGSVREYLSTHCAKDAKGRPEYRVLDTDDDLARDSKVWRDVWARPRGELPWLVCSNGRTGFEGPLPPTVAECLALLRKYGGE
jgi:hypothetical protein